MEYYLAIKRGKLISQSYNERKKSDIKEDKWHDSVYTK